MIKAIRERFNAEFSTQNYQEFVNTINQKWNESLGFRVAETPVFVDKDLRQKLTQACTQIMQTVFQPDFKEKTEGAIPEKYFIKSENQHPHFVCIDFAICKNESGEPTPKLIELQGFASMFAWQHYLGLAYKKHFFCPDDFTPYLSGLNEETFVELMRRTIVGNHPTENVVLLELKPEEQKTRIDFYLTKHLLGVEAVCLSEVIQKERKLFYKKAGREIEIKRIYNRLIFDDLEAQQNFKYNINLQDDLDVQWVAHPNWFYRISKYTMPFLKSEFVPQTFFLDKLEQIPEDLENFVLKPLFSFAGQGVIIDVSKDEILKITDPDNWILQQKVNYEPVVESPTGGVKCEIRMMYLWPDGDAEPTLAINLARLSRGKMIGVRYNQDFDWVGSTVALMKNEI